MPSDRRSRKRLATRASISDAATRLFLERGFDRVTIDDVAKAADVGRMTVFNHFPRKEDLFFDRDQESREIVRTALRERDPSVAPIEALRLLAHRLVAERSPLVEFSARSRGYVETIERSDVLKSRVRAIRDELTALVAAELARGIDGPPNDPDADLAAGLVAATWSVALLHAHDSFRREQKTPRAKAAFLAMIDRGSIAAQAAMAGTRYAG